MPDKAMNSLCQRNVERKAGSPRVAPRLGWSGTHAGQAVRTGHTGWTLGRRPGDSGNMLQAFVFERVGVVVGDLYFLDPDPHPGQEGPEHGVRLELRVFDRGELKGTIYSAMPIAVGQPIWRVDLLESVDGKPGSFDRTHHHPTFNGWNPSSRVFLRELS